MRNQGKTRWSVVAALIVAFAGIAIAAFTSVSTAGWHLITLYSSSTNYDTGVALVKFSGSGSDTSASGVFFRLGRSHHGVGSTATVPTADSTLALKGAGGQSLGTPLLVKGTITTAGAATLTAKITDTASLTISQTYSAETTVSSQSWASPLSSTTSGTATDTFLSINNLALATRNLRFDTTDPLVLTNAIDHTLETAVYTGVGGFETSIFIRSSNAESFSALRDTARIILFGPDGTLANSSADTFAKRSNGNPWVAVDADSAFIVSGLLFDTGVNNMFILFGDTGNKLSIKRIKFYIGATAAPTSVSTTTGATATSVFATSGQQIQSVTVNVPGGTANPAVAAISISDIGNDFNPKADDFAYIDSGTSTFDTRLNGSVFAITPLDAAGNEIQELNSAAGQSILVAVSYNFANLTAAQAANIKLARKNSSNQWEACSSTTIDSANRRAIGLYSKFSSAALVGFSSSSSSSGTGSDGDCAISRTVGGTSLAGVMPSLRGLRDSVMTSSLGRLFVSGYYSLAGMMMLIAAGLGMTLAVSRQR